MDIDGPYTRSYHDDPRDTPGNPWETSGSLAPGLGGVAESGHVSSLIRLGQELEREDWDPRDEEEDLLADDPELPLSPVDHVRVVTSGDNRHVGDIARRTTNAERKSCYPVSRPGSASSQPGDTTDRDAFYSLLKSGQSADISRLGAIRSRLGRRDFERVCRESRVLPLAFFLDKTESSHVSYRGYNMGSDLAQVGRNRIDDDDNNDNYSLYLIDDDDGDNAAMQAPPPPA